jgi:hypothetical protein
MKIFIILIIIILLLIILYNFNDINNKEKFISYIPSYNTYNYDQRYCKNCNEKSVLDCGSCYNCGICVKNNISTCKSGDIDGPENDVDCDQWIYGNFTNRSYFPYYYNYYYPYYYDMFYPPYYYDGLYYNTTYNYPSHEIRDIKYKRNNKHYDRNDRNDRKDRKDRKK